MKPGICEYEIEEFFTGKALRKKLEWQRTGAVVTIAATALARANCDVT